MAQEIELFYKCPQCSGTGKFQSAHGEGGSEIECNWPGCENGFISQGRIGSGLYFAYQIVESTDLGEYNALSAANKDRYKAILSCGILSLAEGSTIKSALWTFFGEGTTTRANLEALIA